MKLPGINYQTAGPDVSGLPAQEGRAWASAADNWATAIDNVSRELEAVEIEEELIKVQEKEIAARSIAKRSQWNVAELGQPDASFQIATRDKTGQQASYPMHEFAGQYYTSQTQSFLESHGQNLSRRGRRAFEKRARELFLQGNADVLESQYKNRISMGRAAIERMNDQLIKGTTNQNWQDQLAQAQRNNSAAAKAGYFTPDQLLTETRRIENEIYYARHAFALQSDDIDVLNEAQADLIASPGQLNIRAHNSLINSYQSKINAWETNFSTEMRRQEARDSEQALVNGLISLAQIPPGEHVSPSSANAIEAISDPGHKRIFLGAILQHNKPTSQNSTPEVVRDLQLRAIALANPALPNRQQARAKLAEDIAIATAGGHLVGNDPVTLMNNVNSFADEAFQDAELSQAKQLIETLIVGAAYGTPRYEAAPGEDKQLAAQMLLELFDKRQQEGVGFNHIQWVEENVRRFESERQATTRRNAEASRLSQYDVRNPDGSYDIQATLDNFRRAIEAAEGQNKDLIKQEWPAHKRRLEAVNRAMGGGIETEADRAAEY